MVAKSLWENSRAMNPPVVVPEEAGAACQPGVVVGVVTVVYCPAGAEVAVPAGALIGCPAGADDPAWAVMKVPFWEYALLATMIDSNYMATKPDATGNCPLPVPGFTNYP